RSHQFLTAVAEKRFAGFVKGQQLASQIVSVHDVVGVLEQLTIAFLAGEQLLLVGLPPRDVAARYDDSGYCWIGQLIVGDGLDDAPGAVLMPKTLRNGLADAGLAERLLEGPTIGARGPKELARLEA